MPNYPLQVMVGCTDGLIKLNLICWKYSVYT